MGQESSKSSRRSSSQRYSDSGSSVPSNQRLHKTFSKKYSFIPDRYKTLEQVQQSLRDAGLESSNLIVGIDLTKSNEWTGKVSFQGRSLHALGNVPNPYEQATSIIGRTLADFDDDNLIPCYGFGDGTTHDQHVFSFFPGDRPCQGFEEALARYRTIIPHVKLAGPTSFAPIIDRAVGIVEASGGQYHILLIIADGQVTRSVDMADGELSPQEQATVNSIVNASNYPLSIVLVGVGDGPWDMMKEFDDNLPQSPLRQLPVCGVQSRDGQEQRPVCAGGAVCADCADGDPQPVQGGHGAGAARPSNWRSSHGRSPSPSPGCASN